MHGVHLIKARRIAEEQFIDSYEVADKEFEEIEEAENKLPTVACKEEEPGEGDGEDSRQSSDVITDALMEQLANVVQRRVEQNIARASPSTSPSLALQLQRKRAGALDASQLEDHHFLFRVLM